MSLHGGGCSREGGSGDESFQSSASETSDSEWSSEDEARQVVRQAVWLSGLQEIAP